MSALTTSAISGLTTAEIAALATSQIAGLTSTQVGVLTTVQIGAISSAQIAALTTLAQAGLTTVDVVALKTTQIAGLTADQVGALSLAQRFRQNAQERAGSLGEYSLPLDKGIPVREVLTQIFTHRRAVTAKEFVMYFCYVAVFVAVVLQINQTEVRAPEEAAPRRRQPCLRVRVLRRYPGVAFSPPPPALPPALLPHRSASTAPTWRCTTRF